jgi:2-alkenal reductase
MKSIQRLIIGLTLVSAVALAAIGGAAVGGAAVFTAVKDQIAAQAAAPTAPPAVENQPGALQAVDVQTAITDAVAAVSPAVVTVINDTGSGRASGSGVIISQDGYLLTNNHVVEGARSLSVIFQNGDTAGADLIGRDPFADVAVIKVAVPVPAVARLGNSDTLKPGETVIAIGSPLGDFKNTVTVGVVSATGRSLETLQGYALEDLIQTDAAINHGLVVRGNGFSGDQAEGLGFAVAANTVNAVSEQIIQKGYVARPYLGVQWEPITPALARQYGLGVEWGIYITDLAQDGPAGAAGLRPGDIITAIGGTTLDESHPFINALLQFEPGQSLPVQVYRDGQRIDLDVTLGERPQA